MSDDRAQVETALANFLLDRIRSERFPSPTHMQLLEQILPRSLHRDYVNVLLEKVVNERYPSIPMLQRIIRVSQYM